MQRGDFAFVIKIDLAALGVATNDVLNFKRCQHFEFLEIPTFILQFCSEKNIMVLINPEAKLMLCQNFENVRSCVGIFTTFEDMSTA